MKKTAKVLVIGKNLTSTQTKSAAKQAALFVPATAPSSKKNGRAKCKKLAKELRPLDNNVTLRSSDFKESVKRIEVLQERLRNGYAELNKSKTDLESFPKDAAVKEALDKNQAFIDKTLEVYNAELLVVESTRDLSIKADKALKLFVTTCSVSADKIRKHYKFL